MHEVQDIQYFDVEGVPVMAFKYGKQDMDWIALACDMRIPRPFSYITVHFKGTKLTQKEFEDLIKFTEEEEELKKLKSRNKPTESDLNRIKELEDKFSKAGQESIRNCMNRIENMKFD